MANRYWVGGTGTWNGTSTTNWSASSGGATGASVPTSADNVFFDANSNTGTAAFTVTMATVAAVCADLDASAVDGTLTLAGTVALDVYGSFRLPTSSLFTRAYSGLTTFRATTTGKTISLNGGNLNNVVFDGVGGGWTLSNAFSASGAATLTNGSIDLNGFTWTSFSFVSNNSNARTLAFNGGSINLTANTTGGSATLWNCPTVTNFTITGTPTVNATADSTANTRTFSHGNTAGGSENNSINLTILLGSNSANLMTVQGVYKNLNFSSISSTLNNSARTIYGNLTISNNMTLTAGTNSITFSGANATQLITSGGRNFDFPINFGYFYATTAATGNGTTATLTFASTSNIPAVGSTILIAGVTPAGYNGTYTVTASTNTTVSYLNATTGAQTVAGTIGNAGSTTYVLQDALTVATPVTATPRTITLNTGTLDLNDFTLSNFGAFSSNISGRARGIAFGTGNITCTYNLGASNNVWNCATITGFTVSGTPTVNITGTSSGAFTKTVAHGSLSGGTEPNAISVNVSAGSDLVSVTGCFINLNLTGFAGTFVNNTRFIYGNLILASGISSVAAGTFLTSFARASGAQQITSAGYNLDSPITFGYNLATTAATGDGTTATLTIGSTLNCIAVGSTIIVSGVTPAGYNGTYTVTASTNTTVSYLNATTGSQTVAGTIVNGGSTTYTLQDALNVGTSTSRTITLNTGTLNLNNFNLTNFGTWASNNINTRSINFGSSGAIRLTNGNTSWSMATITNFTRSGTPSVLFYYGVPGNTTTIQHGTTAGGSEANSMSFRWVTGTAPTVNIASTNWIFDLEIDSSASITVSGSPVSLSVYGSYSADANPFGALTFKSTSATTRNITITGTSPYNLTFDGVGGSWQLQSALTIASTRTLALNNGAFNSNNLSITTGIFSYNNSSTKSLLLGTSTVTITGGTSTLGFVGSNAGTTYDVVNSTIVFTNTGTFSGGQGGSGGNQFGTITMSATGGTLYLGLGTLARCTTLNNTVSPCTITNACTTGFTVDNFNVNGTAGNLVTLNSSVAGTARTISKSSGTVSANYLSIQDSTATGGATWNAYNSVNVSNNTGWNFLSLNQGNFLMFF